MIEIYLLEQLAAFKKYGTLSEAAEHLHLTQPSLSRSMRKIEDALGVSLFTRGRNYIELNESGKLAAEYAERVLEVEREMTGHIRAYDRSRHTISFGTCSPGPSMLWLPAISQTFQNMTITSEIRSEEELLKGLSDDTYTLICLSSPVEDDELVCLPAGQERLYLSVPPTHHAAMIPQLHFADMNGESFLMASTVGVWDRIVRTHMPDSRFLLQSSPDTLKEVADQSTLPAFNTDVSLRANGGRKNRIAIPFMDDDAVVAYYMVWKKKDSRRLAPIREALLNPAR